MVYLIRIYALVSLHKELFGPLFTGSSRISLVLEATTGNILSATATEMAKEKAQNKPWTMTQSPQRAMTS